MMKMKTLFFSPVIARGRRHDVFRMFLMFLMYETTSKLS